MVRGLFATPVAAVILAVGAADGCSRPSSAQSTPGVLESEPARPLVRVTAAPVQRKDLKLFTSQPGRIEPFEMAPLVSKIAGYVDQVLVDIGDTVKKGQPLVTLSVPELQDEVAQMEALVAQAEADIRQAEAAVHAAQAAAESSQARVQQAQAGIARAEGEYDRAKAENARIGELAAAGSVTRKLADETLNQLRSAEASQLEVSASVAAAKASTSEALANVRKAEADQGAATSRLRVANANLARARTMLAYGAIRAPFDGVITQRAIDTGHFVQPASGGATKPLVVVTRTDQVRLFFDIPELEATLVDTGEHGDVATIQVQALGSRQLKEKRITRSSWALDAANRSLRAEIDVPNEGGLLRPGMYATANILLEERRQAISLPITAIVREGKDTLCCVVKSGTIVRQPIQLGLRFGDDVEVLSGLDEGRLVVVARPESLTEGQRVEVLESEKK